MAPFSFFPRLFPDAAFSRGARFGRFGGGFGLALFRQEVNKQGPAGALRAVVYRVEIVQLAVMVKFEFLAAGEGKRGKLGCRDLKGFLSGALTELVLIQEAFAVFLPHGALVLAEDLCLHGGVQGEAFQLRLFQADDRVVVSGDRFRPGRKVIVII